VVNPGLVMGSMEMADFHVKLRFAGRCGHGGLGPKKGEIRKLTEELEKERGRNKGLVGRIAIVEGERTWLAFDAEEMHKPILKPVRSEPEKAGFSRSVIRPWKMG
jgi:hypothetical protein